MIFFRKVIDLILDLWRNDGRLELFDEILSLGKILPDFKIFMIQSIDFLQQDNNS